MKKKLISLIMATVMSATFTAPILTANAAGNFSDVSATHWAYNYISDMTDRGVVSGYPDGRFYPNNDVTRAEFARIMTSASGISISTPSVKDFEDVATNAWYAPYVHAAYPYLSGYSISGKNYYMPDTPAIREDIAVALVKLKGYSTEGADESILTTMFTDVNSISNDARKYVAVAVERGLVSGYEDNTFKGQNSISRAEATAMLWRAYQYGNDNKTYTNTETPIVTATPVITNTPATSVPTVVSTPTPTPVATIAPTPTPTEEPTPTPYVEEYAYSVETVCDVSNLSWMTVSGFGDIYYLNNNTVYVVDVESGRRSTFFDPDDMEYEDENSIRRDYRIDAIAYNNYSDRLYMFGSYTTMDFADEHRNKAFYDITDGDAELIHFSNNVSSLGEDEYYVISMLNSRKAYIYCQLGIEDHNSRSTIYDLNNDTYQEVSFGNDIMFYNDSEMYAFTTFHGLMKYGSTTASSYTTIKRAQDISNALVKHNFNYNNSEGFTVYNEQPFYFGKDLGSVYTIDSNGMIYEYINADDVEMKGDNDVNSNADYFSLEYNGLPIWYDSALGAIKRYVSN